MLLADIPPPPPPFGGGGSVTLLAVAGVAGLLLLALGWRLFRRAKQDR